MSVIHYLVNVEVVVCDGSRYLMIVRSELEEHAPGALSFPGGKVEDAGFSEDILESTARREALEEAGVAVSDLAYVESKSFVTDRGDNVVDVVFLARYDSGDPVAGDPEEVGSLEWMTFDEIVNHPKSPPWTIDSIRKADTLRRQLGWL